MGLIIAVSKPKRELYGFSRFANQMEIHQAGLLKLKHDKPDILVGKCNGKFLRWSGNKFVFLDAPTSSGKGVSIGIPSACIIGI